MEMLRQVNISSCAHPYTSTRYSISCVQRTAIAAASPKGRQKRQAIGPAADMPDPGPDDMVDNQVNHAVQLLAGEKRHRQRRC